MPDTAEGRRLLRRNVYLLAALGLLMLVGFAVLGVIANAGRLAGEDSLTATKAQFAGQARSACITERRSIQSEESGRMQVHTLRALDAAFVSEDDAAVVAEVAAGLEAAERWEAATATLEPAVLDLPRSQGGCGPAVTSAEQLNEDETQGEP